MAWASNPQGLLREALLALVVLALAFLNFGHESAVLAANGRIVVTAQSVCGDPASMPAGDHFACHACKPDAMALPPAPVTALPVRFCAWAASYADITPALPVAPSRLVPEARGPPAV